LSSPIGPNLLSLDPSPLIPSLSLSPYPFLSPHLPRGKGQEGAGGRGTPAGGGRRGTAAMGGTAVAAQARVTGWLWAARRGSRRQPRPGARGGQGGTGRAARSRGAAERRERQREH